MPSYWLDEDRSDEDEEDEELLSLGLLSWRPSRRFILGLDLGQVRDPSALAVVQRLATQDGVVQVPHLERFPLRTPYPTIVSHVQVLVSRPPLRGQSSLVIDTTGVGAPVVDLFVKTGLHTIAITITGGDKVHRDSKTRYSVPKRELVGCLQVMLQTGRLKIARALPQAELLVKELLAFQVKITASAHDTYGAWREGAHDDLVLALALATWYGEHG